jgi:hypothetical protein
LLRYGERNGDRRNKRVWKGIWEKGGKKIKGYRSTTW